jgi:hypothetical protein
MKKARFIIALMIAAQISIMAACKKKKEEAELITTVQVEVKKGDSLIGQFQWKDLDGEGGADPLPTDTIPMDSGVIYKIGLQFLNESINPAENITEEISAEAVDHLVCFTSAPLPIAVTIKDSDGTHPIGLATEWIGNTKGTSKLRIILRHQPGVKDGTCEPGETDVDVEFPISIK